MALPQILSPAVPAGTDSPRLGDDEFRALKQFLADLFGFPTTPTTISAAIGSVSSAGKFTLTNALWNGDAIPVAYGGTNLLTYTTGDLLYASAATTLAKLADVAAGSYLRSGGVGAAPLWSTLTLPNTTTINRLIYSSAANVLADLATANNGLLVTSGTGVPSIATDIPTAVTVGSSYIYRAGGTDVAIADGGTNSSTALNNSRIMVSSGGAIVEAAALTNGQLLIGSTGAAPVGAGLTAGTGITVTPGAGSITIAASGGSTITAATASVGGSETTTSTTYTDLVTSGPTVTVTIGPSGILVVGLRGQILNQSSGFVSQISFALSGGNTRAAADDVAIAFKTANAYDPPRFGAVHMLTGLAASSTTITAKYNVNGGTGEFGNRHLWVMTW